MIRSLGAVEALHELFDDGGDGIRLLNHRGVSGVLDDRGGRRGHGLPRPYDAGPGRADSGFKPMGVIALAALLVVCILQRCDAGVARHHRCYRRVDRTRELGDVDVVADGASSMVQ